MSGGITAVERALRAPKDRPALVAYLTGGWPERERFASLLRAVALVADVVEIGIPFSDPMADGPTIQRTSRQALEQGVSLDSILGDLERMNPRPEAPILLMSYLNPLLAMGIDTLVERSVAAGVSGFIVPDLPLEEAEDLQARVRGAGLGLVQLVTPVSPEQRSKRLCAASDGFVYAVTVTGITGGEVALPLSLCEGLARLRGHARVPVMAGFGIRSSVQVQALSDHVDGVIVGTALLEAIERGEDPAAFLLSLFSSPDRDVQEVCS